MEKGVMATNFDSAGNLYFDVSNMRVTYVSKERRADEKDWGHVGDCLRFQAYKGEDRSGGLFPGAEIDLGENAQDTIGQIILGIGALFTREFNR